jgi:hypothetical protein
MTTARRRPVLQHAAARSRTRHSRRRRRRRGHQMTGRPIMLSGAAASVTGALEREVTAGRRTGMRCHQDTPHPEHPRSRPHRARPQRSHHRRPPREHPGTVMMDALPAARHQASGQQAAPGATPPAVTGAIRRSRISGRSVTPESTACPAFGAY